MDAVLAALTRGGAAAQAGRPPGRSPGTAPDDLDAFQGFMMERGWGDGLPMIPPTPERVARMLAGSRRRADDWWRSAAAARPRDGGAIAVNAVMAGALPEHLPVILAAVEAVAEPAFNLQAIQTTTHPCSPLVIVNGPIVGRLGINAAGNALGQGLAPTR